MALSKSQQSLREWTAQKWRTSSGKKSEGKRRYLPDAAWKALTRAQRRATNAAKSKGDKKGKQFVAQPESVAKITKQFR